MPAVSLTEGAVAVTGASGYIGSWIVQDLVEQGYRVHACVRDISRSEKVDHLLAMNETGLPGNVELKDGDLFERGSYDDAFRECAAVIHVAAPQGYNQETAQQTYDGVYTEMHHLVESVKKAVTVRRFVFTSSFAAVTHPAPDGYVFTEKDWASDNIEGYKGAWAIENIPKMRHIGYKMAQREDREDVVQDG